MERAKRIATALIGIAVAAHCSEMAVAQQPGRFIRQPAKAPTSPSPAKPIEAPATPAPVVQTPVVQTPAAPAPVVQTPASVVPTIPAMESTQAVETPKPPVGEVKSAEKLVEAKSDPLLSFPSLLSVANSPDLEFDSAESFATVPDLPETMGTKGELKLAIDAEGANFGPLVDPAPRPETQQFQALQTTEPKSNKLQWTSRASGATRPQPSQSSEIAEPQIKYNSPGQSVSVLNRPNQSELQSASVAKQQTEATNELLNRIATRVDAIESKFEKADEPAEQQRTRASLVSARITSDPRFARDSIDSSVTRIESPQGWQAIGQRLSSHVSKCESLLRRGAFCSAREEAEAASMLLFRHIDLHDNLYRCEPAAQAANQALREAEDFVVAMRSNGEGALRRLIDSHETTVLKNKNLTGMSPLTAAQHYRHFAESKLTEAAQGHPWASELLYTVGRTYQAEADVDSSRVDVLRMKAMAYYRASRITMPSNAIACNQLGYLLLQMDRNEEARETLVAAVALKTDVAFISNLAEASRRLGDTQTVAWAATSVAAIRSSTPPPAPVPPVVEVSQEDFIAISPRAIGPKPEIEMNQNSSSQSAGKTASAPNAFQLR